ncbi:MAG: hypothetical protein ACXVEF_21905 [Polyangiales bacterium]
MRFRFLLLLLPSLALAVHCGSNKDSGDEQPSDSGADGDNDGGEVGDDSATDGAPSDTKPDTGPATVTCTKGPAYGAPIRVNHNPDSLRRVANAGMIQLDDGTLLVAMLEALDATRFGVFARIVDPATGKASDDERLDVDADSLTEGSGFQLFAIAGGAAGVRYDNRLRVYSKGKWSPDLSASLAFASGDTLQYIAAPNGQVLVTRAKGDAAPFGQAIVYRPDEGGAKGSWSAAQSLDLDGATGKPRIDRHVLSDGRFMTLIWQGAGGPAISIRSLSGAWQAPYPKGEIGALSTTFDYRVLSDGSIVAVALEPQGPDTFRATTSTWTAMDGWSTTRLLSKVTADGAGVVPTTAWPFLYGVSGDDLEFVSWVAACAGAAKDCTFKAVSRRYTKGAWNDPVDLMVGTDTTGPDGLSVVALDGKTPLLYRQPTDRSTVDLRARIGTEYFALQTITKGMLFGGTTQVDPHFYGGAVGLWSLAIRTDVPATGPSNPLGAAAGVISPTTGSTTWDVASAGGYEVRSFSGVTGYADGSGGFTVATNNGTDGMTSAPILAHFGPTGGMPEGTPVVAADESTATFVSAPKTAPRLNRDRAAIFLVLGTPSDSSVTGKRLRAYAWNGIGSGVPKPLATDTRNPRKFADSLLVFGCGGAILYAIDPIDGTHALELVIVKEATGT